MPQVMPQDAVEQRPRERDRAVRILARSLFRQLKADGFETRQIVALSSELLGLVTTEFHADAGREP